MPHVERNRLSFHVQHLGAGPPLVMLHGLLVGSLAGWYLGAAPRLAKRFRVTCYDLRGHGLSSPAASGYDLATMAGDLAALTGDEPAPLTLVGHSWGALVALGFALAHPARVARLVLVEAPLPPSKLPELEAFLAARPEAMLAALPAPLRAAAEGGSRRGKKQLEQIRRLVAESTLLADLRAERDLDDDALRGLRAPALLVYGDRSSCRPAGERLARTLPHAELVVLPGGHFLPVESAQALNDLLEARLCPT
jgi:pimeloyl-ACP methyl ester carboxylesterase